MIKQCKKCQKEITDEQFRLVSEWTFCIPCFEELMNPAKKEEQVVEAPITAQEILKKPKHTEEIFESDQPAEEVMMNNTFSVQTPKQDVVNNSKCQMCGCKLENNDDKFLGVWRLCENCQGDLAFKLSPAIEPEEEEVVIDERPRDLIGHVILEKSEDTECSDCSREIPLKGAKMVDELPYCPDCFYKNH